MTLLWIYLGVGAVEYAISLKEYIKYAKEVVDRGYETVKKHKHPKLAIVGTLLEMGLIYLFPIIRTLATGALLYLSSNEEFLEKTIQSAVDKGTIKKTDAKLKEEAESIVREEKFKQVREELGDGKIGEYDSLSSAAKIECLDKLENKEISLGGSAATLTDEELEMFLRQERKNIIEEHKKEEVMQELKNSEKPKVLVKKSEM